MVKKAAKLEIKETLICKDIQQHPNATFSLLGLYPQDIAITTTPATLSISLWINFIAAIAEDTEVEIKVSSNSTLEDDIVNTVTLPAQTDTKNALSRPLAIKHLALPIINTGEITISYKSGKSKWKTLRSFNIEIAQSAKN